MKTKTTVKKRAKNSSILCWSTSLSLSPSHSILFMRSTQLMYWVTLLLAQTYTHIWFRPSTHLHLPFHYATIKSTPTSTSTSTSSSTITAVQSFLCHNSGRFDRHLCQMPIWMCVPVIKGWCHSIPPNHRQPTVSFSLSFSTSSSSTTLPSNQSTTIITKSFQNSWSNLFYTVIIHTSFKTHPTHSHTVIVDRHQHINTTTTTSLTHSPTDQHTHDSNRLTI